MKIILSLLIGGLFCTWAVGQDDCSARVSFSSDGKRPTGIENLMRNYRDYTKRNYVGRIAQVNYDPDNGTEIIGFALETNGIREAIDVTHDGCLYSMSPLEISWVPYVIKKGNRVRINAELSGSGGYINARNIYVLATNPTPPRKAPKKQ